MSSELTALAAKRMPRLAAPTSSATVYDKMFQLTNSSASCRSVIQTSLELQSKTDVQSDKFTKY